jgi:hypothetical protein
MGCAQLCQRLHRLQPLRTERRPLRERPAPACRLPFAPLTRMPWDYQPRAWRVWWERAKTYAKVGGGACVPCLDRAALLNLSVDG